MQEASIPCARPEASDTRIPSSPYTCPPSGGAHSRSWHSARKESDGLEGQDTLERWADSFLNEELGRFRGEITRVEVRLSDEAKGNKGDRQNMRCMLEARLNGHQPVAVQHFAETMDEAIRGASAKLVRALVHTLGRLDRHEHRTRETIRRDAGASGSGSDSA